ncbi:hypothetical protein [Neolewinella persica]|uniref:hypothetical protein n=1 Tax=Neolewinella persica TaxID=70998 RepID=UPI0012FB0FB6|nr:hypothetical protein [Neolewinella persica]
MKACLTGILLSILLFAQAGRTSLLLQWQQLANESFTELFCVNKAWEDAPMCYGACQLTDLFQSMETDEPGDQISSSLPYATSPYCQLPTPNAVGLPPLPTVAKLTKPATIPLFAPRSYVGYVFEPPTLG